MNAAVGGKSQILTLMRAHIEGFVIVISVTVLDCHEGSHDSSSFLVMPKKLEPKTITVLLAHYYRGIYRGDTVILHMGNRIIRLIIQFIVD